jgi:hypothetical protein
MLNKQRAVPDWLVQLVWFVASVYATGALWYFLSKDDYVGAGLSVLGAVSLAVVAVYLHRLNDRSGRQRRRREALAAFLDELRTIRGRSNEEPPPLSEYSAWVEKVSRYLAEQLDSSYVTRFGDFTGMVFYSSNPNSGLKQDLDGRARRLHEFITELGGVQ